VPSAFPLRRAGLPGHKFVGTFLQLRSKYWLVLTGDGSGAEATTGFRDDGAAFTELFERHFDDIYRYLVHPRVNNSDVLCCRHATCSVEAETW